MVVCNVGSRCCTRRLSNWHKVLSPRSAQARAVWVRWFCREHGVLRRFALCYSGIHFRIHSWIRLLLHHHRYVHRGAKQIETRNAWTGDVAVVHGLWRNRSTWQHAVWSGCRSIWCALAVAFRSGVGLVLGMVVQCFCTGCKKQVSTESVTGQLAQEPQLVSPSPKRQHPFHHYAQLSQHHQWKTTGLHSYRFHTQ